MLVNITWSTLMMIDKWCFQSLSVVQFSSHWCLLMKHLDWQLRLTCNWSCISGTPISRLPPLIATGQTMAQNMQDGSICIRDVLASLLDSGRTRRHVIHLDLQSGSSTFFVTIKVCEEINVVRSASSPCWFWVIVLNHSRTGHPEGGRLMGGVSQWTIKKKNL